MTEYYTYAYLREDGTPYYIGKGKKRRAYKKSKDDSVHPPTDKSRIIFLHTNLTELQAFEYERKLIEKYGRIDLGTGILRNRTNGGEGTAGHIKSEEWIKKHSETMKKWRSENPEFSPAAGYTQTKEHVEKRMAAHIGAKRSDETCKKIAEKATGRVQTRETIEKRILYVTCEHCGNTVDKGNHKRWHGDKCKKRQVI